MPFQTYLSFHDLEPSVQITESELVNEIKEIPLDVIIGAVSLICCGFDRNIGIFDPSYQVPFLNSALIDDFPRSIKNLSKILIFGRTPVTGGRHIFIHEQNLSWLVNCALFNSDRNILTPEIGPTHMRRVARLLLLINDILPNPTQKSPVTLSGRREFCLDWIRSYQFNHFFQQLPTEVGMELARNKIIFSELLPKHLEGFEDIFEKATGVPVKTYFLMLATLIVHLTYKIAPDKNWIQISTLFDGVSDSYRQQFEKWLSSYVARPDEYENWATHWCRAQNNRLGTIDPATDFKHSCIPLNQFPFIHLREDQMVCAIPELFFLKIADGPFFQILDSGQLSMGDQKGGFGSKVGLSFELYASNIAEKFAQACDWQFIRSPKDDKQEELADYYLQKGNFGIAIEFKADRPGLDFIHGRSSDRILGPNGVILNRFENEKISLEKMKKLDTAYLTEGIWQLNHNLKKLESWALANFGQKPDKILTMIVVLSNYKPDEIVIREYIRPLSKKISHKDKLVIPQYLNIREFESLFELGRFRKIDPSILLEKKILDFPDEAFEEFLKREIRAYPPNLDLLNEWRAILKASEDFFEKP